MLIKNSSVPLWPFVKEFWFFWRGLGIEGQQNISLSQFWRAVDKSFVILQAGERRRKIRLHRCLRCRRPGSWNDPGKASGCHCLIPFLIFPLPSSTSVHSSPIYFPILREENYFILPKNTTKIPSPYQTSPPLPVATATRFKYLDNNAMFFLTNKMNDTLAQQIQTYFGFNPKRTKTVNLAQYPIRLERLIYLLNLQRITYSPLPIKRHCPIVRNRATTFSKICGMIGSIQNF